MKKKLVTGYIFETFMEDIPSLTFITLDGLVETKIFGLEKFQQHPVFEVAYSEDWEGERQVDVSDIGMTKEAVNWLVTFLEKGNVPHIAEHYQWKWFNTSNAGMISVFKFLDKFGLEIYIDSLLRVYTCPEVMIPTLYRYHIAGVGKSEAYFRVLRQAVSFYNHSKFLHMLAVLKDFYDRPDIEMTICHDLYTVTVLKKVTQFPKTYVGVDVIPGTNFVVKRFGTLGKRFDLVVGTCRNNLFYELTDEDRKVCEKAGWGVVTEADLKDAKAKSVFELVVDSFPYLAEKISTCGDDSSDSDDFDEEFFSSNAYLL